MSLADAFIFLKGGHDLLKIKATKAKPPFVVWRVGNTFERIIDEVPPYEVTVIADEDSFGLQIDTEGEWSVEVTSK